MMESLTGSKENLQHWLDDVLGGRSFELISLAGDASFRRYYRVASSSQRCIAMDASSQPGSCASFVAITNTFRHLGLHTPKIIAKDIVQGFLLLSDLGDKLYYDVINDETASTLYHSAFDNLLMIQSCQGIIDYELPRYDAELYGGELNLFRDWYLQQHLGYKLSTKEQRMLLDLFELLIEEALLQPQVCVHRDYHSRNLMVLADHKVGILDFQDAVWGPITYDLVSLLRDCYIDWPLAQVERWAEQYRQQALRAGLLKKDDADQFIRWFDWMGVQRHLKCLGIFARLYHRDRKPRYLDNLPRMLGYVKLVCERYPEFRALGQLLEKVSSCKH